MLERRLYDCAAHSSAGNGNHLVEPRSGRCALPASPLPAARHVYGHLPQPEPLQSGRLPPAGGRHPQPVPPAEAGPIHIRRPEPRQQAEGAPGHRAAGAAAAAGTPAVVADGGSVLDSSGSVQKLGTGGRIMQNLLGVVRSAGGPSRRGNGVNFSALWLTTILS
jgi:hypothetical protein